ncbi:DMT family transporter [Achromobacter piechaudii]|uniref:Amino-acid metabolite efflux pump n=1 Tax=Achromobacter piechaudii TaxID=72556 RepID=A0ABM8KRS3_9BURK|nr:DMT family transporter [Achromobacter piechaudii]CAB3660682.1 putative amino-acid metabolite efflux pump [Achromobacter piechaudii]CAB3824636.1 putative amino-acid metabolite efflux pump [Achromobacter piechaudii]CAB3945171.1 putative amino-acid metabolite efflux pump [Achromobacter piechaudii]
MKATPVARPPNAPAASGISWVPIAAFCFLWSSAFAAAKIAVRDCPPLTLLTIRFLIAGVLMLGIAAYSGRGQPMRARDLASLILLGVLNNALYLGLSWSGMTTVSSAFTAVLISTNPLLIGVLAGPVLGERLNWRKLLGLCLGLAGVAVVLRSRLSGMQEDMHGTLLVTGGLVALVAGTLLYKRLKPTAGLWTSTGIQSLAAAAALLPFALMNESLGDAHLTTSLLASMAYMIVAVSMGGYYLWFMILSRASATSASALHFLMPPLGLLFGWLVLREPVSWLDLLGIVPIAIGIWLTTRKAG